ncbi:GTP 3',8-cyclase MoaA [Verrucomicrobiota bacterium sgz303538]
MTNRLPDRLGRPLRDLRISVTDRCNFRCAYCMPREVFGRDYPFLPRAEILSFEEITRLARVFVSLGVEKIRLTGGEPLLRRDLEQLISQLSAISGLRDLTLTTNGSLLEKKAQSLRYAGLKRVTVSLDSLNEETFRTMNDVELSPERVVRGIDAALVAGFGPIKINMVVKRGVNDDEVVDMAQRFQGAEYILRFIEYMDVGNTNGWRMTDVVPAAEIVERISRVLPLEELPPNYQGEVARRFRHRIGGGEIGVITSVTQPFCGDCSRARLSSDGKLFTCLFAATGRDLRQALRSGATDEELAALVRGIWSSRTDRYSELRSNQTAPVRKAEMSMLGG